MDGHRSHSLDRLHNKIVCLLVVLQPDAAEGEDRLVPSGQEGEVRGVGEEEEACTSSIWMGKCAVLGKCASTAVSHPKSSGGRHFRGDVAAVTATSCFAGVPGLLLR